MSHRRDPDKARTYINALDVARCQNSWHEVPELARKVAKHAPQRKGLTTIANAECKIATSDTRTHTASSRSDIRSEILSSLGDLVEGEFTFFQDGLQAKVCLAWGYWINAEHNMVLATLPDDFRVVLQEIGNNTQEVHGWTEICVMKGAYMKAIAQQQVLEQSEASSEALSTFQSLMSWVTDRASKPATSPQQLFWEEQFLAQAAIVASEDDKPTKDQVALALTAYRLWAQLTLSRPDFVPIGTGAARGGYVPPQLEVWRSYYNFLSRILQQGLPYLPSSSTATMQNAETKTKLSLRSQQAAEIRRCESSYESNFLKSVKFPKASESNQQVEEWIESVIRNWQILCGPDWYDEDLGQGGQNAVGRNVLDILYRAATKTFHSTLILRRLFQVHAYLTDFDLALKALESYIEIMTRGHAREEETGESDPGLDNEETFLSTIGEGTVILSQYGDIKDAEKAKHYADLLETELQKFQDPTENVVNGDTHELGSGSVHKKGLPKSIVAITYRNIGVCIAHWARWTPVNESRSELQLKAIGFLRKSLALSNSNSTDLETTFALGLLLAETREINGAIEVVKSALLSNTPTSSPRKTASISATSRQSYQRERNSIPLWHLLALLLSSRQDFDTAVRSCEAAFEQFPSPQVFFGQDKSEPTSSQGQSQSPWSQSNQEPLRGVIDSMGGMERARVLEIRMTELALTELLDGPELAVNSSNELLSLFLRLFSDLEIELEGSLPPKHQPIQAPPKSSAGTLKSFKGTLFGRKKANRSNILPSPEINNVAKAAAFNEKPTGDGAQENPRIRVTDEALEEKMSRPQSHSGHVHNKLHRREGSLTKRMRYHSEERKSRPMSRAASSYLTSSRHASADGPGRGTHARPHTVHGMSRSSAGEVGRAVTAEIPQRSSSLTASDHDSSPTAKQPLPSIPHNVPHAQEPRPPGHATQPPQQDIRLPVMSSSSSGTQPTPCFPKAAARKLALGLLVKVWLLIAGLYRRASMFEDAREACEEASKHASQVEAFVAEQESSARAFADRGWGGGKSSDELWADVLSERGFLLLAESSPHTALEAFEQAVLYHPDHVNATIGLAGILLDIADQKIPPELPRPSLSTGLSSLSLDKQFPLSKTNARATNSTNNPNPVPSNPQSPPSSTKAPRPNPALDRHSTSLTLTTTHTTTIDPSDENRKTPSSLNRIAARDRAYGLLSTLTKLGTAWDSSEAWLALSRAYEMGGEMERAKECLWWVIELEDRRPVRHWWGVGGGYVL